MDLEQVKKKAKEIYRNFIVINIGLALLGIILIIFPDQSKDIICRAIGIMLCIWGVLNIIDYIRLRRQEIFGSFGLVSGCACIGFGTYIIIKPDQLAAFIVAGLSIVLFICGVIKLQHAIDFAHVKSKGWIGQIVFAVLMIAAGVVSFLNPFGASDWLMRFVGIALTLSSIWDIITIIWFNKNLKEIKGESEPRKKRSTDSSKFVDVEVDKEE